MENKLEALRNAGAPFMVAGLPDGRVAWFVPNLDVTQDPEDWAFHALSSGIASDLAAAADAITASRQLVTT